MKFMKLSFLEIFSFEQFLSKLNHLHKHAAFKYFKNKENPGLQKV